MTEFHRRCVEIAARFLQTVVIVDDEAYFRRPDEIAEALVAPPRRTAIDLAGGRAVEVTGRGEMDGHSLNAGLLVESFSRRGIVCGVIAPQFDETRRDTPLADLIVPAVKRADIVILDWRLNRDDGAKTISILQNILASDAVTDTDGRLRLVAIYTGEQDLSGIGQRILDELDGFDGDENCVVLSRRHCRILIYAKSDTPLASDLGDRSISESEMPEKLIHDFAHMTEGLLPSIALTSLAAIRTNAHRILERFDAKLDPAFLSHRACLPFPDDAQQHMSSQLANELHGIIADAMVTDNPAGMESIEAWLTANLGPDAGLSFGNDNTASREETIELLAQGWEKRKPNSLSKKTGHRFLTSGFSHGASRDNQLDHQLAWMFNFRTVFNGPAPILKLGSVLRRNSEYGDSFFLCMRPTCDSVRLEGRTIFLLIPLERAKDETVQIVS